MEILRTITFYVRGKNMPFLLIGGHAVNAYGISRQTGDIDFVIPRSTTDSWRDLLLELRYTESQADKFFSRFKPDSITAWPIDLMYLEDEVFKVFDNEATLHDFGETKVRVVSANHLLMLKLHAMKTFQEHRYAKDYTDVIMLLRHNRVTFNSQQLRELCKKYASEDLYEKISSDLEGAI